MCNDCQGTGSYAVNMCPQTYVVSWQYSVLLSLAGAVCDRVSGMVWAARYNTWLLIKLTPKGVVFSSLFFSFLSGMIPLTLVI